MQKQYSNRVDSNQKEIVRELRQLGFTVEINHDDVLVGYQGKNYWYEIKNPNTISKKTGNVRESAIKESQKKLCAKWKGHYRIVTSTDEIINDILNKN